MFNNAKTVVRDREQAASAYVSCPAEVKKRLMRVDRGTGGCNSFCMLSGASILTVLFFFLFPVAVRPLPVFADASDESVWPGGVVFDSAGTYEWDADEAGVSEAHIIIVGGGGGGGAGGDGSAGGGGGAGGMVILLNEPVSGAYKVVVGAGGEGATALERSGGSSKFGDIEAFGGGGGGDDREEGADGGSGGGGGRSANQGGSGTGGQGHDGRAGSGDAGGGGGGAGKPGGPGWSQRKGGDGVDLGAITERFRDLLGDDGWVGGGGSACQLYGGGVTEVAGGLGGGGASGSGAVDGPGSPGMDGTGGGGGAGAPGARGGDGLVAILPAMNLSFYRQLTGE